jgi:predicted transcriptional regulator
MAMPDGGTSRFPHTTTLRLDAELNRRVQSHATQQGLSNSEVVRIAVREHFARLDGREDAARESFDQELAALSAKVDRMEKVLRRLAGDRRYR